MTLNLATMWKQNDYQNQYLHWLEKPLKTYSRRRSEPNRDVEPILEKLERISPKKENTKPVKRTRRSAPTICPENFLARLSGAKLFKKTSPVKYETLENGPGLGTLCPEGKDSVKEPDDSFDNFQFVSNKSESESIAGSDRACKTDSQDSGFGSQKANESFDSNRSTDCVVDVTKDHELRRSRRLSRKTSDDVEEVEKKPENACCPKEEWDSSDDVPLIQLKPTQTEDNEALKTSVAEETKSPSKSFDRKERRSARIGRRVSKLKAENEESKDKSVCDENPNSETSESNSEKIPKLTDGHLLPVDNTIKTWPDPSVNEKTIGAHKAQKTELKSVIRKDETVLLKFETKTVLQTLMTLPLSDAPNITHVQGRTERKTRTKASKNDPCLTSLDESETGTIVPEKGSKRKRVDDPNDSEKNSKRSRIENDEMVSKPLAKESKSSVSSSKLVAETPNSVKHVDTVDGEVLKDEIIVVKETAIKEEKSPSKKTRLSTGAIRLSKTPTAPVSKDAKKTKTKKPNSERYFTEGEPYNIMLRFIKQRNACKMEKEKTEPSSNK